MNICLAGSTGFIGSVIAQTARGSGAHMVTAVKAPRISSAGMADPAREALDWVAGHGAEFQRLVDSLHGDVAVNAAGLAAPASSDVVTLRGANAIWPTVLSLACREAAVPRLVHVSSAAVQGRRDPLDESTEHTPFSAYSRSKAEGEGALLQLGETGTGVSELVIYRPTSVQGAGRRTTASLVRLSRVRHLPVTDGGRQPLPLVLVADVARACLLLAGTPEPPAVALHPWEGMTTARLLEWLAPGTPRIDVPPPVVRAVLGCVRAGGQLSGRARALSRQLDLLYLGQRIDAHALRERGYASTTGVEDWQSLARSVGR
jgi:nucleoside-diphosphate-sugar epimerase